MPSAIREAEPITRLIYWILGAIFALVLLLVGAGARDVIARVVELERGAQSRESRLSVVTTRQEAFREQLTRIENKLDAALEDRRETRRK